MGEQYEYHITMLITAEQEDAMRLLFKEKHWVCKLRVLSDEIVAGIILRGFSSVFPVFTDGQKSEIDSSEHIEVKSEVVDDHAGLNAIEESSESKLVMKLTDVAREPSVSAPMVKLEMASMSSSEDTLSACEMPIGRESPQSLAQAPGDQTLSTDVHLPLINDVKSMLNMYRDSKSDTIVQSNSPGDEINLYSQDTSSQPYTESYAERQLQHHNYHRQPSIVCIDCHLPFRTLEALWQHRNEAKHDLPKEKPNAWKKRGFSPEELIQMGYLLCNACFAYFQDKRRLRKHYYTYHRELMPSPTCSVCSEVFSTREELHKHKREKQHNSSIWMLNGYQCDTCGKYIVKYDNFLFHKQLFCGKGEKELEELKIYPCDICGKRFKSSRMVKSHQRTVHFKAKLECDICGKICNGRSSLRAHKIRHDERNKNRVCLQCGKAFFTNLLLDQHKRTHTKEKPFKCPLCSYTCAFKHNINKHAISLHHTKVTLIDLRKVKDKESNDETAQDKLLTDRTLRDETAQDLTDQ